MMPDMKPEGGDAYDQPLRIEAHNGEVVITGPGAASVALTARAAAASADLLAGAAKLALAQTPVSEAPIKSANGA